MTSVLLLATALIATVPRLSAPPVLDGRLNEQPTQAAGDEMKVRVAMTPSGLWIGANDESRTKADRFELWLRFRNAGLGARPFNFRVTHEGATAPEAPEAAPSHAVAMVKTAWKDDLELLIPNRALPRFPSHEPLQLELCGTFRGPGGSNTSCRDFDSPPAVELTEALIPDLEPRPRRSPPVALEGRAAGWLAFGDGLLPLTVWADRPLSAPVLNSLVAEKPLELRSFGFLIPSGARSPRGRVLRAVLAGEDPLAQGAPCNEQASLRLGFYEVVGKVAYQVLEVPAATCALGRAVSAVLEGTGAEAELRISYSGGQVVSFIWSGDHYERTEYGKKSLHDDPRLPEEPGRLRGDARHPDRPRLQVGG